TLAARGEPADSRTLSNPHRPRVEAHRLQPPESAVRAAAGRGNRQATAGLGEPRLPPRSRCAYQLTALKGIGNWTADIYLLSALRRPDIWPVGDLALATAVQEVKRLRQ